MKTSDKMLFLVGGFYLLIWGITRLLTPAAHTYTAPQLNAAVQTAKDAGWNQKRDQDADLCDAYAQDAAAAGDERGRKAAVLLRGRIKPKVP